MAIVPALGSEGRKIVCDQPYNKNKVSQSYVGWPCLQKQSKTMVKDVGMCRILLSIHTRRWHQPKNILQFINSPGRREG